MKFIVIVILLAEFDVCTLEVEYVIWSHNRKICNSRIKEVKMQGCTRSYELTV